MNKTIKGATLIIALATSVVMAQSSRHLQESVSKSQVVSSSTQSQSIKQNASSGNTQTKQNPKIQTKAAVSQATEKKQSDSLTVERIVVSKTGLSSGEQRLFISRLETAKKAERFFRKRGVTTDKAVIALLVNAWHECKWDYQDKSGHCIGFFQLKNNGGMGDGYSDARLQNLDVNMSIMAASTSCKAWIVWTNQNPNVTAGEMSYRFAAKVERCASQYRAPRRATANKWFKALKSA